MESGAILRYLADKTGKLIPSDPRERQETIEWLFFQMASVGPMFGQYRHFAKFAKGKTDTYSEERYGAETKRLLEVLDKRLQGREYRVGSELSIADIATVPWVGALDDYEVKDAVDYASFKSVVAWVERVMTREAVQRGLEVKRVLVRASPRRWRQRRRLGNLRHAAPSHIPIADVVRVS